jgi:hypothetical protein
MPEKSGDDYTESEYNASDLKYLKYAYITHSDVMLEKLSSSTTLAFYNSVTNITGITIKDWIDSCITTNTEFYKRYNIDLDKIVIGEGSTNL